MITRLNVASIYVLDKDEALDFYVNKLGLEKGNDVRQGDYRWLTVRVPGEGGTEISLEQPGPPLHDEATAEQLRELITKGALGGLVFITDDARASTRRSRSAASPTSPRSPPTTSTAPTWASAIRSATRSGSSSRARSPRRRRPEPAAPRRRTRHAHQADDQEQGRDPQRRQRLHRGGARRRGGDRPRAKGRVRPQPGAGAGRGPAGPPRQHRQDAGRRPGDGRADPRDRLGRRAGARAEDVLRHAGLRDGGQERQGDRLLQAQVEVQGPLLDRSASSPTRTSTTARCGRSSSR